MRSKYYPQLTQTNLWFARDVEKQKTICSYDRQACINKLLKKIKIFFKKRKTLGMNCATCRDRVKLKTKILISKLDRLNLTHFNCIQERFLFKSLLGEPHDESINHYFHFWNSHSSMTGGCVYLHTQFA